VYVQSPRLSTLASSCFMAPRHRAALYCVHPPRAGSVGHRRSEGSTAVGVLLRPLLLEAALALLVDIGGFTHVAGVATTSVKCLRAYANVHVMFFGLMASTPRAATYVAAELLFVGVDAPTAMVTLFELFVGLVLVGSCGCVGCFGGRGCYQLNPGALSTLSRLRSCTLST
jgi:hypothetical protein